MLDQVRAGAFSGGSGAGRGRVLNRQYAVRHARSTGDSARWSGCGRGVRGRRTHRRRQVVVSRCTPPAWHSRTRCSPGPLPVQAGPAVRARGRDRRRGPIGAGRQSMAVRRPGRRPDDADRRHGRGRGVVTRPSVQAAGQRQLRGGRGRAVQRPDRVLRADCAWPAAQGRDGAGAWGGRRHRNVGAAAGAGARGVAHHRGGRAPRRRARSRRRPARPTWC